MAASAEVDHAISLFWRDLGEERRRAILSRTDHPSLDISLFRSAPFAASIASLGLIFFLSFYLRLSRDFSPIQTGALLVPFAVGQMIFAPLRITFVKRYGARAVSAAGLLVTALTIAYLG